MRQSFVIAEITPVAFTTIGWRYFIVFAGTNFLLILPDESLLARTCIRSKTESSLAVWLFFPETNGRHLEEVDQIFRDISNIFDPVKMARQLPSDVLHLHHHSAGEKRQSVQLVENSNSTRNATIAAV